MLINKDIICQSFVTCNAPYFTIYSVFKPDSFSCQLCLAKVWYINKKRCSLTKYNLIMRTFQTIGLLSTTDLVQEHLLLLLFSM